MRYIVRESENQYDGYEQELVRLNDDGTEHVVYIDGGEPEDMLLCRNLGVFVDELNRVAADRNAYRLAQA